MEHSLPPSDLARPWRTATLVATAIAGLELVLLVIAGMVLLGKSLAPHVHAAAARVAVAPHPKPATAKVAPARAPVHPARAVPLRSRAETSVLVLNGNGVQGAAAQAAVLVGARGYRVRAVSNAPHTGYARWMVIYRPGFAAEAKRFARDLNVAVVEPLDGLRPAQLHGAQVLLIVGASR